MRLRPRPRWTKPLRPRRSIKMLSHRCAFGGDDPLCEGTFMTYACPGCSNWSCGNCGHLCAVEQVSRG